MMIRRDKSDSFNREYLYYLMNDLGLLNDYALYEIGITFDEYDDPDERVLDLIEDYKDQKSRD